jgi:galactose mutarotase-like enzyme
MNQVIHNGFLTVEIADKGAELQSIRTSDGHEYLWQGNPKYWEDRAVNLFPTVGRLMDNRYVCEGKEYEMKCHGFAQNSVFVPCVEGAEAVFTLRDSEETRKQFPFAFTYQVSYALEENRIKVTFRVINHGDKVMPFGLGGHPGFFVPMEEGKVFEDYRIRFPEIGETLRAEFSEKGLFVREYPYEVAEGEIPLEHGLFDNDAIVLRNSGTQVVLEHKSGEGRAVEVSYPQMPYIGFWQAAFTDANYLCIEPWQSLPGREGVTEDWMSRPGMIALQPGETYENQWVITIR